MNQKDKKKAKSPERKGEKEKRGPGRIEEYNFFVVQGGEDADEAVPEGQEKKRK